MKVKWKTIEVAQDDGTKKVSLVDNGKPTMQISYLTGAKNPDQRAERKFILLGGTNDPSKKDEAYDRGERLEADIPDVEAGPGVRLRDLIRGFVNGYVLDGKKIPADYHWKRCIEIIEDKPLK